LNDTSPTSPDAINPIYLAERLTALLGRTANKVGDVSVHPLKTGTSGDQLYRVEPRADGQPFSLILKLNRSEDIAETLFYRDLCPRAGIDTPRVLDARVLTDGGGWLLMEELKPKDDLSWTEEDYRAVVSDMARMHARYLNSPELDTYPWLWRPTPGALAEITGGLALLAQALRASPVPSLVSVYSEERLDRIAAGPCPLRRDHRAACRGGGDPRPRRPLVPQRAPDRRGQESSDRTGRTAASSLAPGRSATSWISSRPMAPTSTGSYRFPRSASPLGTLRRSVPTT
jgi:hypothetical protein